MMERTPITPDEFRIGDRIRAEAKPGGRPLLYSGNLAEEWVVDEVNKPSSKRVYSGEFNYYLLERPKPKVELPSERTLGWLTWTDENGTETVLTEWLFKSSGSMDDSIHAVSNAGYVPDIYDKNPRFEPATAVRSEALAELRIAFDRADEEPSYDNAWTLLSGVVLGFLNEVEGS